MSNYSFKRTNQRLGTTFLWYFENFSCFNISYFLLFVSLNRKFADIEAANHRLASALYFKEEEKNASSLQSQKPEMPDQLDNPFQINHPQHPEKCSIHKDADDISKPPADVSVVSHQTEVSEKKQLNSGHLWKRHPKSQSTTCTTRKNSQSRGRQKRGNDNHKLVEFTFLSSPKGIDYHREAEVIYTEHYEDDNQLKPPSNLSEHTQTALQDAGFIQNVDISPSFSPALSPLSLDSCDFSIQMLTDISACTHSQKSIPDIAESQWTDIMDLFSGGNSDVGGCMDVEAYFESICSCQGDAGQEVSADEFTFSDQSDSLTERMCNNRCEDLHCERGEYRYVNAYSCHGDEGLVINNAAETQFNNFKPAQSSDIAENQLHTSINYHYNVSELQTYQNPQVESHCMLGNCENHLNFTPFEGVAQSFSAPLHNPEHRPIPTPPREDDWLFTDILKDRKSPGW